MRRLLSTILGVFFGVLMVGLVILFLMTESRYVEFWLPKVGLGCANSALTFFFRSGYSLGATSDFFVCNWYDVNRDWGPASWPSYEIYESFSISGGRLLALSVPMWLLFATAIIGFWFACCWAKREILFSSKPGLIMQAVSVLLIVLAVASIPAPIEVCKANVDLILKKGKVSITISSDVQYPKSYSQDKLASVAYPNPNLLYTGVSKWRKALLPTFDFDSDKSSNQWTMRFVAPYWILIFTSALASWIFYHRARKKRQFGLCLKCGYNLTGNVSGVCPECGTFIEFERALSDSTAG